MTTNSSSAPLSVRQMAKLLKKFSVHSGDILALKHQSENANSEAIKQIVAALEKTGINAMVVVVKDFDDLKVLNETEMNKRGWFRLEKLSRIRIPVKQEEKEVVNEGQI
jgi:hypothetical protein